MKEFQDINADMDLVFFNSHPIQYFAPLYHKIAENPGFDLTVFYLSDETLNDYKDAQFGVRVSWDIPLLDGYRYFFMKNYSWVPSINNGFFGLINPGLIGAIRRRKRKSVIIVHGWAYFSNILALIAGKLFGHIVCIRGETPLKQEMRRPLLNRLFKYLFFRLFLFRLVDKFLYIGEQNRLFYKHWGIKDADLIFTPYAVDNTRFRSEYMKFKEHRKFIKYDLTGGREDYIILYSGKFIQKKRPMDLLKAFVKLKRQDVKLIMMGDGALRNEMEEFIANNGLNERILLTGFINQTELSKFYVIADVFVMCSEIGETWGLSVNEAMNFGIPIVVSDLTGCSDDLVEPGRNGLVFKAGNVDELACCIEGILSLGPAEQSRMRQRSLEIIDRYSYGAILDNLKAAFPPINY